MLLACMLVLMFSCEEAGPDDCYAVDITREECLARGNCTYLPSFFVFTNDDGCLVGEARTWFPGRSLFLGVCAGPVEEQHNNIDNFNPTRMVCRQLTQNLHQVIDTTWVLGAKLSEQWRFCYYENDWMFPDFSSPGYFTGDCRPRCGDGIVDQAETCETGGQLSFENCSDLGTQLERDYLPGELYCYACTQNFHECVSE